MPTTVAYLVEELVQRFNIEKQDGANTLRDFIKIHPELPDKNVYLPGENEYQTFDDCYHFRTNIEENGQVELCIHKTIPGATKSLGSRDNYTVPAILHNTLTFHIDGTDADNEIYYIVIYKEIRDEFFNEIEFFPLLRWELNKKNSYIDGDIKTHLKLFLANYY